MPLRVAPASGLGGGVRWSDDAGSTWRMLHGAMPPIGKAIYQVRLPAVHPGDADTVLIATGTRVRGIKGGSIVVLEPVFALPDCRQAGPVTLVSCAPSNVGTARS